MQGDTGLLLSYIDLLGKPFKYGGRGPEEYDCQGLACEIYKRAGMVFPVVESTDNPIEIYRKIETGKGDFLKIEEPEPLCVVTFWIKPPYTTHIGVVLPDNKRFIHILKDRSVAVERLDSIDWKRRNTGFFKLRS